MLGRFLTTQGRARRSEWWLLSIGLAVLGGFISILLIALFEATPVVDALLQPPTRTTALTLLAMQLVIWWPMTALFIRRAHDRNQRGIWAVIYQLLTLGLAAFDFPEITGLLDPNSLLGVQTAYQVVTGLLSLALLVTQGFLDGTPGPNRYGQSPKGLGQSNYTAPIV